jgi:parallel beta-helix repeat protein
MAKNRTARLLTLTALLLAFSATLPASAEPQVPTYTVNSDSDAADANPGDGVCATAGGNCTLHAAIQEANLDSGASTITFASHVDINYPSLPALTEGGTLIDGSDQWDMGWDRPGVKIGGGAYHNGLLVIQADSCIVQGIEFAGGQSVGIHIDGGSYNRIGGSGAAQRNVFTVGTGGTGVWIDGGGSQNTITGNYFGTWDGTTAFANFRGVFVQSSGQTIENNLIVGATDAGIELWAGDCIVRDNIIGANKFKNAALPNAVGIRIDDYDLHIIGPNNFIAGNTSQGIMLNRSDFTSIFGNQIGPWSPDLGNGGDGIHLHYSNDTLIGGPMVNDISNNDGNGVYVTGDRNKIWDNTIRDNGQDGVYIEGEDNEVGGGESEKRNEINGNGANGVHLRGMGTFGNTVAGNYIGLARGEALAGNAGHGVLIEDGAYGNTIGGSGAGEGNWINGKNYGTGQGGQSGVYLSGGDTHNNTVVGNIIGAPVHWQWKAPIGHHGISIYNGAHDNYIGVLGLGNTILSSNWSGIAIVESNDNLVWFNKIGTDGARINWGNNFYGVAVVGGTGNVIAVNEIAYNGTPDGLDEAEAGVYVGGAAALGNTISANSIHDNDGPGIKLVEEGNYGAEAPTITAASCRGGVEGIACPGCTVEVFSDADDEGQVFEDNITANPEGFFSVGGSPNGPYVTATATDGNDSTSAFSSPFYVGPCNTAPTAAFTVTPTSGFTSTLFSFDTSGCSDTEDPVSALQVRWDWETDGLYDTDWSTTKTASHTFTTTGQHTIRLEVQDTAGLADATTRQVTVSEQSHWVFLPLVVRD